MIPVACPARAVTPVPVEVNNFGISHGRHKYLHKFLFGGGCALCLSNRVKLFRDGTPKNFVEETKHFLIKCL